MGKTYQPFIIQAGDDLLENLKDELTVNEYITEHVYMHLTQRFIDGKFSGDDTIMFDTDEELDEFVNVCLLLSDMKKLQDKGLVNTLDNGESFFITEAGKEHAAKLLYPEDPKD